MGPVFSLDLLLLVTDYAGFAGIGLLFFIGAGMGLCYGVVLKTVLIIPGCFCYC